MRKKKKLTERTRRWVCCNCNITFLAVARVDSSCSMISLWAEIDSDTCLAWSNTGQMTQDDWEQVNSNGALQSGQVVGKPRLSWLCFQLKIQV